MTTTSNVTMIINGQTVCADIATIASLLNMTMYQEKQEAKQAKQAKAEKHEEKRAKVEEKRAKHDAILDSKRVDRMTKTATGKLEKLGFQCKTMKQGKWICIYPTNGEGRKPEFKAAKLAKGWKHSMKRGAFYRDFSEK